MITGSIIRLRRPEYDVYSRAFLQEELETLSGSDCTVDFDNVRYMDSTCLGALIAALKRLRLRDSRARMTLVHLSPNLHRIFEITRLTEIFSIKQSG